MMILLKIRSFIEYFLDQHLPYRARELTQSQTILQNQIERVSDHLFEKGAMVIPGEIGYDLNYYSVKLTSFTDSQAVGVTLSDFVGLQLTGATSGVVAKVINQTATDGTDPNTLYVKYVDSGTNSTSRSFTAGETISVSTTLQGQVTTVSAVIDSSCYRFSRICRCWCLLHKWFSR